MDAKKNPDKNFLICYCFACHGMHYNGRQIVILNEYDSKTKFYKYFNIENRIRFIAEDFRNSYQIAVFACCRETMVREKHTNGSPTKEEAIFRQHFLQKIEDTKNDIED